MRLGLGKALVGIMCISSFFVSCGSGYDDDPAPPAPKPKPGPGPGPGPVKDSWATLAPIVQDNCALSGCHASSPFVQSKDAFLASKSIARIGNGSMPPRYSGKFALWNDDLKDRFLKWSDEVK